MRHLKYFLAFLVAISLSGQRTPVRDEFSYWKTTSGTEVITVQQPASDSKDVFFTVLNLFCSTDAVVEMEKDGTAATTTSVGANVVGRKGATATVTVFHTSNVGAGTKIEQFRLRGGSALSIDLEEMGMQEDGTGTNWTWRSDCTGTGDYYIRWREE